LVVRALLKKRSRILLISVITLAVVGIGSAVLVSHLGDPKRVAFMLNIPSTPKSLSVSECESGPPTDVVITCAIEIDPTEFSLLLKGYTFSKSPSSDSSYALGVPKLGPEFTVANEYLAKPSSFKHGGSVRVFADAANRRAVVDLYIE
jgi:hypothetical protein